VWSPLPDEVRAAWLAALATSRQSAPVRAECEHVARQLADLQTLAA
jgi:hypothetical protein